MALTPMALTPMAENIMKNKQEGFGFLHVLAIILAVVIGGAVWKQHTKNEQSAARIAEIERNTKAEAERQAVIENQKKLDAEKLAFNEKVAREATKSEYEKSMATLVSLHSRWIDAVKLADSTSRVALATPLANLQQIKRDTEALMVPDCYTAKKKSLVAHMDATIDGFIAFMQNQVGLGERFARMHFEEATKHLGDYTSSTATCPKDA